LASLPRRISWQWRSSSCFRINYELNKR
jgi:hypothetical protein